MRRSTGRVGPSYGNALAESFFQGLKRELLHGRSWTSKAQTRLELFRRLSYYNRRRRHSALSYLTPAEFEQQLITSRTLSLVARNPVSTPGDQHQSARSASWSTTPGRSSGRRPRRGRSPTTTRCSPATSAHRSSSWRLSPRR
ncbi:integrase core domain-containing protein [Streptomyces sp. NPDC059832]|uniref:integrase core domain-containing protein n=1 Tax=Streptomyces sp. NPDC059832 TaxID=3346966 RepID=UPI0036663390